MDLDPRIFFNLLFEYAEDDNVGPKKCSQLFTNLNDVLTREQLNISALDLYLQHLFSRSQGLLCYITKIINKKPFQSSVTNALEIIYILINNFSRKVEKYVVTIYDIAFKVIKSSLVTSTEKVKALEVVILSFEKINKYFEHPECYKDVYNSLFKSTSIKKCDSVQEKLFKALGTLAKHIEYVVINPEGLRNMFLGALEMQMVQKEFSNRIVSGAFSGLDHFCESFPFDLDVKENEEIINKLYRFIEKLVIPTTTVKIANRAALTFLANYISMFVHLMMEKFRFWHDSLLKWLDLGADDQKVGVLIVDAFYRGVGEFLKNDTLFKYKDATLYFNEYFKNNLTNDKISTREKRLSLQGLSSLCDAYQFHLSEEDITFLFNMITQNFEKIYILNQEPSVDVLEYLPFYLHTVTKFVHVHKKITNNQLFCLQRGSVIMIKSFPQLPYSSREAVVEALVSTFYFLSANNERTVESFIQNVVYQGVVWTCSHQHVSEVELLEGNSTEITTVKNYLGLWKELLGILPRQKYDKNKIFLDDRRYILIQIIDKLMKTMLLLINKLNVSIVLNDTNAPVTDIQSAYTVAKVNDFAIFLNMVDFYEEIFHQIDSMILKNSVCKLIRHLIVKCGKYPLISGFYKLLSFCLKTCNRIDYFRDENSNEQDSAMCYLTLVKFSEILLKNVQQYKGDLLISCLQVLLEYPVVIIRKILLSCVPSFKAIFYVGRTYIKLADLALDALESWQREIPCEEMEPFLKQVMPFLDCYLQSKSLGSLDHTNVSVNRRKTAQMLKKRKVLVEIEPELIKLQMRILKFIGQQNSSLCYAFATCDSNMDLTVWGNQQHLKITLPYEDIKLDIYLDKLVPRITNLALNSTDRQTRVMACELFQATMMVFLGTTKQMSQSGQADLSELLKHVSVPLLKLGCDMDQVVEQLFKPLCFQMIHWYTHVYQSRTEHSAIFIEAVLESITHPTDTALRDFSGKCLNEFVKWTIKQTSEKNMSRDPVNIKILLKKMRFYSMHPDPFKKLGAALIFNNIYREVREESALLSMFWIEFLHLFVRSLSTYEVGVHDENSVAQIYSALSHIERGFIEKSVLFNSEDKNRRVPTDMKGGCLNNIAIWLLEQTGTRSQYCRSKCMELFCSITPFTKKYTNLNDFVNQNFNTETWISEIYESFLVQDPTLDDNTDPIKWMQDFLCALDGYIFAITNNLVKCDLSNTLTSFIRYFIETLSTIPLDGTCALVEGDKMRIYTVFEKQIFDKQKSQGVEKCLELFTRLDNFEAFYAPCFWEFVINIIFNRQILGFECFLPYEEAGAIMLLLKSMLKKLSKEKIFEFRSVLRDYVIRHFINDFDLKSHVTLRQRNIVKGLTALQSFDLNELNVIQEFSNGMVSLLLNKFIDTAEEGLISLDNLMDTTLNYGLSVFDFTLDNENEFEIFVNFLYKPNKVQTVDCKQPITFGMYLVIVFEDSVIQKIITNFEIFLSLSLEQYKVLSLTVEIISYVVTYASNRRLNFDRESVVKILMTKWDTFEEYFNGSSANVELGLNFVKCLLPIMKLHHLKNENLKNWLCDLLVFQKNLSGKCEVDIKADVFHVLVDIMEEVDNVNVKFRSGLQYMKNKLLLEHTIPLETKINLLDKLLCVLPKTRSSEFLVFLLDVYVQMPTEQSNTDMKNLLTDYVLKSRPLQEKILSKVYNLCFSEELDSFQKCKLIANVSPLFQNCSLPEFEEFFVANISRMISILKESTNPQNLSQKIIHYILLELLFLRCPVQSTDTEISRITQTALPQNPNNKSFLLQLLKCTLDAVKDSLEDSDCELFRLYKCHAYNAMVSIVSNSMTDSNFYLKLFIRQENNVDILWRSLIDVKKKYVFPADFDAFPKRRKILINIRDELRTNRKQQSSQLQTPKYVESVRVYNSSLSEDFTKFDFTDTIVRSQSDEEPSGAAVHIQSEIELDSTDVNTHECMPIVCGLIEHMVRKGITELPTDEDENYELPAWVKGIISLLMDAGTHDNIKIFWIKVIDNTIHIFKHFAKWFLEPLLKFIVDKCAGDSINYFIADVVAILTSWSVDVVPNTAAERQLASELIVFLISNLNNERQDIFKYHLELIRLLIEAWKTSVVVPHDLIYSKLNVEPTSRKVEIGIHLSSIFLANKITPWKDNWTEFCKTLFSIVMKSKHRSTYKPCAETIGLLLRHASNEPSFSKVFGNVQVLLKKINDPDKYALVLEALVVHFPRIADEFNLNLILSRIHGVSKPLKMIYMRIILSQSDKMSSISDFKMERWDAYIENDNFEVQLLALEIVHNCLNVLKDCSFYKSIIESVCKHVSNSNLLCRSRMFDIAIKICQNRDSANEEVELCKTVLVQGLTDGDTEIREKVYDFWRNESTLPNHISARLPYILSNLYEASTENDFLGYSSYLLLDIIKTTEQYNSLLFEHPLEDCDFENYDLQTNWRARHLSVVPLFAETVRSSSQHFSVFSETDPNKLRQTQTSREFAITQTARMQQLSQITMSESSLFVKTRDDNTFLNPNLVTLSQKYLVPKRRFLRNANKIRSHFANQEVKKSQDKIKQRIDSAKERENKVTIFRNYRKGDLPDVQITLQSVLEPLQNITLHDGEISKILYSEIFKSTLLKMRSDQSFVEQVSTSINSIFNSSVHFYRNLFQTLFEVLILSKNEIVLSPDLVATVCHSCGLRTLGILLLEEYIISHGEELSDAKKARGFQNNSEINIWVKMAELYKEMEEWDAVKSIFLEKNDCPGNVKDALAAESRKQWKDAQDLYKNLIESDESLERKDFYYESYFKCFSHLGEWTNLVGSIEGIVSDVDGNSWNNLWDQSFNQQKLLPWYISGQLKSTLFTQNSSNQFFMDLNRSLNSEKGEYLQNNFSEEIAMLWVFKGEIDEAQKYLQIYINNFLDYWQQLDSSYSSLRYHKLLKLCNVIDINKFVNTMHNLNVSTKEHINELTNYWNRTVHGILPSILFTEEKVLYRKQFLNVITNKLQSTEDDELKDILSDLTKVQFRLNEQIIDAAIEQNNFYMTKKYLNIHKNHNSPKVKLGLSKLASIKAVMLDSPTSKLDVLLQGCKVLEQIFQDPNQTLLKLLAHVQLFNQYSQISSLLKLNDEIFQNRKSDLKNLTETSSISSPEEIALFAANKLKLYLRSFDEKLDHEMETEDGNQNAEKCAKVANAYVELAYFARKQEHYDDFTLFVLRAMKYNSSEGRQLFPCVLMETEFSEHQKTRFIEETEKIPAWMFLGWVPQILVNVDTQKVSAIGPLIIRIANTYPQAVMFAYRLSKENYNCENMESINLIKKLDEILLGDERVDNFLSALSYVGIPASILLYYVRKIKKACHLGNFTDIRSIQKHVLKQFFNCKPDSRDVSLMQGNMFKKIVKYEKDFKSLEGLLSNASNASKKIMDKLQKVESELVEMLLDSHEVKRYSGLLKDYSPWLANLSACKLNFDLEIPGQYSGNRLPLVQHHVKISSFCPNIIVMSSLRKPIKITILGNDSREYPFLIKFGEDIRQDQRIQQIFSLMNNIFSSDTSVSGRELSILTYQVIPLTTNLGIIQWIDKTNSLQDFVKKSLIDTKSYGEAFDSYHKWIYKSSNQQDVDAYGRAATTYSRDKTIPKFRSLVSTVEWDIFRSTFLKLSTNNESFFILRNNFIKSYAVMCVSHWILGVGDRHLSNTLVCLKDGKVLGIDFGHAFGTATQILPVPELVPFRLTPHLVNLMQPLGEKGLFKEIMIHCLRSLRSNSGSLLATMNVFIEEPSLDWLEHASRFSGGTDSANCNWYPAQKIDQAKRKLLGTSSTTILIEDLKAGHQRNEKYMKAYIKLVEGAPDYDLRARMNGDNLSVEDQVDCLIDHATDYNLLGRMFHGWAAWI